MSNREIAIELINRLPENKIGYVIAYLQGLFIAELADDYKKSQNSTEPEEHE